MSQQQTATERESFHGLSLDPAMWQRLRDIIAERSFSEGKETKLASGATSTFYFNMKLTMSRPEGLHLVEGEPVENLAGKTAILVEDVTTPPAARCSRRSRPCATRA